MKLINSKEFSPFLVLLSKFLINLLFQPVSSSTFEQLKNQIEILLKEQETPSARALTKADMAVMNNYGCWCYFEENIFKGHGQPQDEVDGFCKILNDGYNCIYIDGIQDLDTSTSCDPTTVQYNSIFNGLNVYSMEEETIASECLRRNPDNLCSSSTCAVESLFIKSYMKYAVGGGTFDTSLKHENGFDSQGTCAHLPQKSTEIIESNGLESTDVTNTSQTSKTAQTAERSCCGQYPKRYPFHTYNGDRACCVNKTYNSILNQCCEDGSVSVSCL